MYAVLKSDVAAAFHHIIRNADSSLSMKIYDKARISSSSKTGAGLREHVHMPQAVFLISVSYLVCQ